MFFPEIVQCFDMTVTFILEKAKFNHYNSAEKRFLVRKIVDFSQYAVQYCPPKR